MVSTLQLCIYSCSHPAKLPLRACLCTHATSMRWQRDLSTWTTRCYNEHLLPVPPPSSPLQKIILHSTKHVMAKYCTYLPYCVTDCLHVSKSKYSGLAHEWNNCLQVSTACLRTRTQHMQSDAAGTIVETTSTSN